MHYNGIALMKKSIEDKVSISVYALWLKSLENSEEKFRPYNFFKDFNQYFHFTEINNV